jgi:MFS family permease
MLLALVMWHVADTPRSGPTEAGADAHEAPERTLAARGSLADAGAVLRIPTVRLVTVLQALMFIATTPAVTFLPIYARSANGPFRLTPGKTALLVGTMIIAGGLAGQLLGGNVADWLDRRFAGGRVLVAGLGFGVALPCYALMFLSHSLALFVVLGTVAVLAVTLPAGPLTAAAQDATPPALRATSVAVIMLLSHVLGDVWAPGLVGMLSTALREHAGHALMIVGVPALTLGAIIGVWGAGVYARDMTTRRGRVA